MTDNMSFFLHKLQHNASNEVEQKEFRAAYFLENIVKFSDIGICHRFIWTEVVMLTANIASVVGLGLVSAALIAVFFSPYRRWLGFMLAGMCVWGLIEAMRLSTQLLLDVPMAYSYLIALTTTIMAIIMLLVIEDRRAERARVKRRYIEHTPVYEDEQQCSSR